MKYKTYEEFIDENLKGVPHPVTTCILKIYFGDEKKIEEFEKNFIDDGATLRMDKLVPVPEDLEKFHPVSTEHQFYRYYRELFTEASPGIVRKAFEDILILFIVDRQLQLEGFGLLSRDSYAELKDLIDRTLPDHVTYAIRAMENQKRHGCSDLISWKQNVQGGVLNPMVTAITKTKEALTIEFITTCYIPRGIGESLARLYKEDDIRYKFECYIHKAKVKDYTADYILHMSGSHTTGNEEPLDFIRIYNF